MKKVLELTMLEAAVKLRMSPELITWFTSYAVKQGESRKLRLSRREGSTLFFRDTELESYDSYLKEPWPSEPGKRPYIPTKIREEIKTEAFHQCAVCHTNADTCEIAHIEPVATSKCNHPHNLILLCAHHHTSVDKTGVLGPRPEVTALVEKLKYTLLHYKKVVWEQHANALADAYSLVQLCARLKSELSNFGATEIGLYKEMAGNVISLIGKTASAKQKSSPTIKPEEALWKKLDEVAKQGTAKKQLDFAASLVDDSDFRIAAGFVKCPLCEGGGSFDGAECPVCIGQRTVEKAYLTHLDLSTFRLVACPVCKGTGTHAGEECPVCHGEQQMQQRFAELVVPRDYELVECPLCEGNGAWEQMDCPVCAGDRSVYKRDADDLDISQYQNVECPICSGSGIGLDGLGCLACGEEGHMLKGQLEELDRGDFKVVTCKLCEGTGQFLEGDCPPCIGNGQMLRKKYDEVDWTQFEIVKCPTCRGLPMRGQDCPSCGGEGKMLKWQSERLG